jgi:hypothetical protein
MAPLEANPASNFAFSQNGTNLNKESGMNPPAEQRSIVNQSLICDIGQTEHVGCDHHQGISQLKNISSVGMVPIFGSIARPVNSLNLISNCKKEEKELNFVLKPLKNEESSRVLHECPPEGGRECEVCDP